MKALKWIIAIVVVILAVGFIFMTVAKSMTKKHSPGETVQFVDGDLDIEVFYCRPFKKNRQVFDSLVPYGVTWRTGANEATTFTTNTDLKIDGSALKAGSYTLWTVPNKDEWEVIWNDKMYSWGVTFKDQTASREPGSDVVNVNVPVRSDDKVTEQFTILFKEVDGLKMLLKWDNTVIEVPIHY